MGMMKEPVVHEMERWTRQLPPGVSQTEAQRPFPLRQPASPWRALPGWIWLWLLVGTLGGTVGTAAGTWWLLADVAEPVRVGASLGAALAWTWLSLLGCLWLDAWLDTRLAALEGRRGTR